MSVVDFQNGSDANAGTWDSPFATLEHALNIAYCGDFIFVLEDNVAVDVKFAIVLEDNVREFLAHEDDGR